MLIVKPTIDVISRSDGAVLVSNRDPLNRYARCVGDLLGDAAVAFPSRIFAAQKDQDGRWQHLTYQDALARCERVGNSLVARGLGADRPLMVIANNSLDHLVMALAAQRVGVPYAPVTPAYALRGNDRTKLLHVLEVLRPGMIFAEPIEQFEAVVPILGSTGAEIVSRHVGQRRKDITDIAALHDAEAAGAARRACAEVHHDTLAKILFTSGSTGLPKAVQHTQGMMTANVEMLLQVWPFFLRMPLVMVDWLPWNHCFGSNNNVNLVLRLAGTLYIDEGRPIAGEFDKSLRNIAQVEPTFYFNVPAGYALLANALERDATLRQRFFRRLRGMFFAGAGLGPDVSNRLNDCARREGITELPILSGWGATETGPTATLIQRDNTGAGNIGLPVPGVTIKMVPIADKMELRVRSPSVTPGYFRAEAETARVFDEEGFYCTGDAGRWADPMDIGRGIVFDGRLNDDFKLANGTWVSAGPLRIAILQACPLIKDIVICGHDRGYLALMVWLKDEFSSADPDVRSALVASIARYNTVAAGASRRIARLAIQQEPLSFEAGEITEKGTVNQNAVRARRAENVRAIYSDPCSDEIVHFD